ncbi:hypothetical protein CMV30_06405 [Nibricoccus aquaticus]|uniref:TonB-dependent receptor n=2 Tax=Nibricoccus aquaticus TaxID=2576891 RepID=A0A290QGY1_9BACT|nr:hypothetical protein CMV30_06405 [Nibricoccus aquaticus]
MSLREVAQIGMAALALCCVCTSARSQNETSSALSGEVLNVAGEPIAGASVSLSHAPTGAQQHASTNRSGRYAFSGLPPGGPYTLTTSNFGYETRTVPTLHLDLGENFSPALTLHLTRRATTDDHVHELDKLVVTATRTALSPGPSTALSRDEIDDQPSIDRSLNEYARNDPNVTLIDSERGELTAAGQHTRFNSTQIDGVRLNDMYGLTPNGMPSQGNPFSMETVEAISIDVSPYDASRGGFTGASINAVTRSGTNQFHGSLYYSYRNQNFRAHHPVTGERDPFTDQTSGITFGGPLLPNRLFFFAGYEYSERTEPAPSAGFDPAPASLAQIVSLAQNYGYDPGSLVNPGAQRKQDRKYLTRLDWQIAPGHRLSTRYSRTRGQNPNFADYSTSGRVSLSGHWYLSEQSLDAYSVQLFSRWQDDFSSEVKFARHRYTSARTTGQRFPQVRVNGVPSADGTDTGSVIIGTEETSQLNDLAVENTQSSALGTWLYGNHRITVGVEAERSDFENTFLQNAFGNYSFSSIANFASGTPSSYTYQYVLPGRTPTAAWGYTTNSLFLQDRWKPSARFDLSLGLRIDRLSTNQKPEYNPLFEQTFRRRNDHTFDGATTLAPRIGFTWKLDDSARLTLRGGTGIFQGRAPGVWLSNPYTNDGTSSLLNTSITSGFSPDPDNQPKGNPAGRRQRVDLLDDDFKMPTVARANLALDHRLPWLGFTATLEAVHTETLQGLTYQNLNLRRTGTGPDGRAIYGNRTASFALSSNSQYQHVAYSDVYLLTNTSHGSATQLTARLRRPLRRHWAFNASYTRGRARETSPTTSSTAGSNFSTRASLDPNDEEPGTASTQVRDRFLASGTLRFAAIRGFDTKLTLAYEGRTGRPYSFIFSNDTNGDSADYSNDLLYVPSGRYDPRVRWTDPAQADAFFAYLNTRPELARFAGQVVPRNSERSPFIHQFDLKFTQEISLWRDLRAEFFADIINLGNLLNPDWGRIEQIPFPHTQPIASAGYDPAANQYVYRFTTVRGPVLQPGPSRWQIQTGVRLKF